MQKRAGRTTLGPPSSRHRLQSAAGRAISQPFPPHIVRFVGRKITSVFRLEILLLLARTPGVARSVKSISAELRLDPLGASGELAAMVAGGLLREVAGGDEPSYSFDPPEDVRQTVAELALCYAQRPTTLISLIYAPPEEARSDEKMKSFVDAFKLRKP